MCTAFVPRILRQRTLGIIDRLGGISLIKHVGKIALTFLLPLSYLVQYHKIKIRDTFNV